MQIFFVSDLDVGACIFYENEPIETFNTSFRSTQNKQQRGTKITGIVIRKKVMVIRNLIQLFFRCFVV